MGRFQPSPMTSSFRTTTAPTGTSPSSRARPASSRARRMNSSSLIANEVYQRRHARACGGNYDYLSGQAAHQLVAVDEGANRSDAVEVLGHHVLVVDRDAEGLLEELNELDDAGRVDETGFAERGCFGESVQVVAEQEVVGDEAPENDIEIVVQWDALLGWCKSTSQCRLQAETSPWGER